MINQTWNKFLPYLIGILSCALVLSITLYLTHAELRWQNSLQQNQAIRFSTSYKSLIEKALAENLIVVNAAEGLLRLHPNPPASDFRQLMEPLLQKRPAIREIQLAPNAIIQRIYPMPPGGGLIGLDLRSIPDQSATVEETIETGQFRLAGPLHLIQGGYGLIARKPIYVDFPGDGLQQPRFWGFISLILDADQILSPISTTEPDVMTHFALRGIDGRGKDGSVFFGQASVFENPLIIQRIDVPGGYWELAVSTENIGLFQRTRLLMLFCLSVIGSLVIGAMSGVMMRQWQHLHNKATRDSLTRVFNRQRIQELGYQEEERARRFRHSLSVIMVDLDSFKSINDTYGHPAGDQVLRRAAERITEAVRSCDEIGRFGGEEFVVILPECDQHEASVVAERIRSNLCHTQHIDGNPVSISASLGMATLALNETFGDLLSNADVALYEAKRQGKNRAVHYSPAPIPETLDP